MELHNEQPDKDELKRSIDQEQEMDAVEELFCFQCLRRLSSAVLRVHALFITPHVVFLM